VVWHPTKYNRLPCLKEMEHLLLNLQNDWIVWYVPLETLQSMDRVSDGNFWSSKVNDPKKAFKSAHPIVQSRCWDTIGDVVDMCRFTG
jgi:hypothetical protein